MSRLYLTTWFFQFRDSAGARIPRRSSEIGRFEYLETFDGYGKKNYLFVV